MWPIPYLAPWSDALALAWSGQWPLDAWPNFAVTIGLLVLVGALAVRRGATIIEVVSQRADRAVVDALRARFGSRTDGAA